MDGRAKPLMDQKVLGAWQCQCVYPSACLLVKLVEVVKLVKSVEVVR